MIRQALRATGLLLLLVPGLRAEAATPTITGYQLTTGVAITGGPPGTQLVINGTNLGSSGTVKFNGTTLSYNAWAPTYIRVVVPTASSYPTTAPFTATTGGLTAIGPAFTITASGTLTSSSLAPTISGYKNSSGSSITSGLPGTSVVIAGANLGSSGTVTFNGINATTTNWSATAITVTVPAAPSYPSTGPVVVTTGGQAGTGPSFTITPPPPSITAYQTTGGSSISSAAPGTQVVIVGTNFGASGTVQFNGISATTSTWTASSITATVPTAPSYPNTGPITVTTGGQTATGASFSITSPPPPPPSITGYQTTGGSPTTITSATPGTQVVVVGTNLGTSGSLTFNGISASTTSWTTTAITATVPTPTSFPSAGPVVATVGSQSATGPTFTITAPPPPPPIITGYQSTGGAPVSNAAPGTQIVIVGSNFGSAGTGEVQWAHRDNQRLERHRDHRDGADRGQLTEYGPRHRDDRRANGHGF